MSALTDVLREGLGGLDTAAQIGKGIIAQPIGGLYGAGQGIAALLRGEGLDAAVNAGAQGVEDFEGSLGGPMTDEGQRNLEAIGGAADWVGDKLGHPIDRLGEASPLLGAGAAAALEVLPGPGKAVGSAGRAGRAAKGAQRGAVGIRKTFYDLLREHNGDVAAAKETLRAKAQTMSPVDRAQASKMLKADIPEAVRQREMMTTPESVEYERLPNLRDPTYLTPEQAFKKGDVIVPVAGDTTRAGMKVKRAGIPLKEGVELQGGHEYGLTGLDPWASEHAAASAKQSSFNKAAKGAEGDVLGLHVAMAPQGAHFSRHAPELWREMLRSGPEIDPQHMTAFNTDVLRELQSKRFKQGKEVPAIVRALRDFQGVQHESLGGLLDENPEVRKALLATADKPGWQHMGFPDMENFYRAALDPSLQTGDVGGAVMRASPGGILTPSSHGTYGYNIPGELRGRLEVPVPAEMVFEDTFARFPGKPAQALGSLRMAHTQRTVDQELIDSLSSYSEAMKRALREGAY